jgi:dihydroorotate dehydrogenase (NAD+) catalytic subunit
MIEPDLSMEITGFQLSNPLMLASGILGISIPVLKRVVDAGAGAVISKSIGFEPRLGYENPTIVKVNCGYINAIGLSNPGFEDFYKELSSIDINDLPLIVSLFGSEPSTFKKMISLLEELAIKAYELNLSCPHVKGYGMEVGQDPDATVKIIQSVKSKTRKPVFVKLSPNAVNIIEIAKHVENAGADAITVANTVRAMAIDVETYRPILSNKFGGLSGPAIKPISLRCVYEVFKNVSIPVIGCGGISCWEDAIEFLLAGSSVVQIGTAVAFDYLDVFNKLTKGIKEYLSRKGKRGVKDLVGISHNY